MTAPSVTPEHTGGQSTGVAGDIQNTELLGEI